MDDDEIRGFKVTDKRTFDDDGNPKDLEDEDVEAAGEDKAAGDPAPEAKKPPEPPSAETDGPDKAPQKPEEAQELPPPDFSNFMMSLASSALINMGEVEDPMSKAQMKNLPGARQMIDIILMLEEKTRGNLTPEEKSLIESLVYDLRLKYVKAVKE